MLSDRFFIITCRVLRCRGALEESEFQSLARTVHEGKSRRVSKAETLRYPLMDKELFNRALALRDSGYVEEALVEFRALVERTEEPEEKAAVIVNEASCLNSLRQFQEARAAAERARQISRDEGTGAYADLQEALAWWGEHRHEDALRVYDRVLSVYFRILKDTESRDLYESAQTARGILLATLGRAKEALPLLEEVLTFTLSEEKKGEIFYNLGYCFQVIDQVEKAKRAFEQALRLCTDPSCVLGARYGLATICIKEGALGKALQELEWCEAHLADANLPRDYVYGWLVKVLRAVGRSAEAERYLKLISPSRLKSGTLL